MKIDVINFTDDHKLTIDIDEEANDALIGIAINKILKDRIQHEEEKQDDGKKQNNEEVAENRVILSNSSTICSSCGAFLRDDEGNITTEQTDTEKDTKYFPSDD